jgi:hypothetical protein
MSIEISSIAKHPIVSEERGEPKSRQVMTMQVLLLSGEP